MRRKKSEKGLLILVILVLGLLSAIYIFSGGDFVSYTTMLSAYEPAGTQITLKDGSKCLLVEGTKLTPLMGFYQCEVIDNNARRTFYISNSPEDDVITFSSANLLRCGQDVYTDKCTYEIKSPAKETWAFAFWSGNKKTRLKWLIDDNKPVGYGYGGKTWNYVNDIQNIPEGGILIREYAQPSQYARFVYQYEECDWLGMNCVWKNIDNAQIKIVEEVNKFGLVQYGATSGRNVVSTTGCNVNSNLRLCTEGKDCEYTWDKKGVLDFYQSTNYLQDWAYSPSDFSVHTYNNEKVYCSGSKLYSFDYMKLSNNKCYAYPSTFKANIECCPNAVAGSAVCGSDFKWKTQEEAQKDGIQCISDIQCGGGAWQPDYGDTTYQTITRGKCINKVCVFETKKTECSTDRACPQGEVCVLDKITGIGTCTVQESSTDVIPREETVINKTGGEPAPESPNIDWNLIGLAVLIGGIAVSGLYIFKSRTNRKRRRY